MTYEKLLEEQLSYEAGLVETVSDFARSIQTLNRVCELAENAITALSAAHTETSLDGSTRREDSPSGKSSKASVREAYQVWMRRWVRDWYGG